MKDVVYALLTSVDPVSGDVAFSGKPFPANGQQHLGNPIHGKPIGVVLNFHYWFRTITGMSPLQYQNKFSLQEARTILRDEKLDVGSVSRRIGYESSSQFSREYSRLFGTPPVREIRKPRSRN